MSEKKYLILNNLYKPKLFFQNRIFFCQIGENGLTQFYSKKEGDFKTPTGKWKIGKIFNNVKRNVYLFTNKKIKKKVFNIYVNDIWCDDVKSFYYNKSLRKNKFSKRNIGTFENLYRNDSAYDLIIEIKTNNKPIIKNKGSAIFIHCSFSDFRSTKGCIALKKKDIQYIISHLQSEKYIYIK